MRLRRPPRRWVCSEIPPGLAAGRLSFYIDSINAKDIFYIVI